MRHIDWTPWWVQARECEAMHGRPFAERTWGTAYYRDDAPDTQALPLEDERAREWINKLYASLAMQSLAIEELKARKRRPRY